MSSAYMGYVGCSPGTSLKRRRAVNAGGYTTDSYMGATPGSKRKSFLEGRMFVFRAYGNGATEKDIQSEIRAQEKRAKTDLAMMWAKGARSALREIQESY